MNEPVAAPAPPVKPRRRFSVKEKADYLERFLQSGLTGCEFCRRNNLAQSSLQRWLKELEPAKAEAASAPPGQPLFRELPLSAPWVAPSWAAELCRPNGTILRLTQALSPQLLEQLLRAC